MCSCAELVEIAYGHGGMIELSVVYEIFSYLRAAYFVQDAQRHIFHSQVLLGLLKTTMSIS